nr:monodehydroascorbate reductase [Tanacetum cinerariifolium]
MADLNTPLGQTPAMAPPLRADDQILPHIRWVPIGKSNYYLDLEKSQSNPIYKIVVDLLKNTNFFRAFTASSTIPSIYIQQFWDMILYDKKAGCYRCQLDEQWFVLTKETLREALYITPAYNNQAFTASPSIDRLIDFVNQLGYPKLVRNLSNVVTNDLFQPILYDKKAGCYRCQLDEQWFVLTKETLREALYITPAYNNQAFAASPSIDRLIDFVNQLGYPKLVRNLSNVVTNDLFQPWRALLTIINLCLTGKTSGFERPTAPVLQILWGVVTRTNIDYAERIWEESTQSIHTFIEDKQNRHTSGKKRATLIVIPSIRFTKLIIHHLQRRRRFHPRPDSPLHLPNEEPVLGYLKFSAKGTKREVFEMPIPGSLITAEIQQASYYQEYLAKVDQHRRYLASEIGGVQDPPAPKPTQPAWKHKTIVPKVADEDAEYQKVLEESMKDAYALPRGTLPPVVIRELESGKYQSLPEVPGKGKAKVTEEQVAHDLLSLQKHKKTNPADQYIFQRRVSKPTRSSRHDESPYALLGQSDSEEESKKVVLRAEEGGQDEGQAGPDPDAQAEDPTRSDAGAQAEDQTGSDAGAQAEGRAGSNPDETSKGQAGSNPDETSEGQAGPDPGNAEAKVQSITSLVVNAGLDCEHMDLDVADVSPQPSTEQLDEGFTATAYPKVQENLKLAVEE